jgi:hypothetical protein
MRIRAIVWCLLVGLSSISCGTGDDEWIDLADGIPDEPGSGLERVRSRQLLRVPTLDGGYRELSLTWPSTSLFSGAAIATWSQPFEWSSNSSTVAIASFTAADAIHMRCLQEEWTRTAGAGTFQTSPTALPQSGTDICRASSTGAVRVCPATQTCGCEELSCEMRVNSCKTNLLLELARGEGEVELTAWNGNAWQRVPVPPQSIEVRALLAEAALRRVAHQVQVQPIGTNFLASDSSCASGGAITDSGRVTPGLDVLMSLLRIPRIVITRIAAS